MNISTGQRRVFSYAVMVAMALALAHHLGKDVNWDQLAYHYHAGWSAVENRLTSDYFAGSSQSYFNPYSHLPFYLMVSNNLAPQLVVAGLALIHVLNLFIVYEIAILFNRRGDGTMVWTPVYLAVFFAACNPVFIAELGSTFNEISTSVFILAGWYLLIRGFSAPRLRWVALAGVLIGVGVALKLTNLIFSVTALPLLLLAPTSWKARAWTVLAFALGGLAGALLGGGWWAWQLWELFGNPFFPLFNQFFHSPYYTDAALTHYRFMPDKVSDILLKPFIMLIPHFGVHVEIVAPDLRYAAMVILLALFGLKAFLIRDKVAKWLPADPFPHYHNTRALCAFGLAVLCTWMLWAFTSGNSRYFLAMSMLFSVVLASMLFRFSARPRFLIYVCVSLAAIQAGMIGHAGTKRWAPTGWGERWYELTIPESLQKQPALYVHIGPLPASFLTPFLAPGSSMMNFSGQYVLEENDKIRALLDKHRGNVRVMRRNYKQPPAAEEFNFPLIRLGLEVDMTSCQTIDFLMRGTAGTPDYTLSYVSCKTKPLSWSKLRVDDYQERKRRVSAVIDRLEMLCPRYLQPRGLALEGDGRNFYRVYGNTDMVLHVYQNGVVDYRNIFTKGKAIAVGNIVALEKSLPPKEAFCPDSQP